MFDYYIGLLGCLCISCFDFACVIGICIGC